MKPKETKPTPPKKVPKHQRVYDQIKQEIITGKLVPGSQLAPENELAKQWRMSPVTVVRGLNQLVQEGFLIRRRGTGTFVTDHQHPPLIPGRHIKLGILWSSSVLPEYLLENFLGTIARGVLAGLSMEDVIPHWVEITNTPVTKAIWKAPERGLTVECIGSGMRSAQRHPLLSAAEEPNFDGLITLGIIEENWLEDLLAFNRPTVLVDFPSDRFAGETDLVYVDPVSGYRKAVRHLVDQGLTRIHFVGGNIAQSPPRPDLSHAELHQFFTTHRRMEPDSPLRLAAYRVGMEECGCPVNKKWIHNAGMSGKDTYDLGQRLARLPEDERPQAVVCFNVSQAESLIQAFADQGLSLRGVGASDRRHRGAALGIHVDARAIGTAAASLLLSRLRGEDRPHFRLGIPLQFELAQQSPGPLKKKSSTLEAAL